MKYIVLVITLFFGLGVVVPVLDCQTPQSLRDRYPADGFFRVRPGILMSTQYGANGNLCGAYFQVNHFPHESTIALDNNMPPDDLSSVIREIAPSETKNGMGKLIEYRKYSNVQSAELFLNGLRISVSTLGSLSTRQSALKKYSNSDSAPDLDLGDFLRGFGEVGTARIWWGRRDGCHDK